MSEYIFKAASDADLPQILELQRLNLETTLDPEVVRQEGFVTVRHDLKLLRDMHRAASHAVAKSEGRVVGYALAMLPDFGERIPILAPMLAKLATLEVGGRPMQDRDYLIMGQVCVAAPFRGKGVFAGLYQTLKQLHAKRYAFLVTEVARRNRRSLRAHYKVGFELLHRYESAGGSAGEEEWDLIVWDWSNQSAQRSS